MPWTRAKTVRWMIGFTIAFLGLGVAIIVVDVMAAQSGESATISHVMRMIWVSEPWVVLLVLYIGGILQGWFLAHFFAAGKATYQQIRDDARPKGVLIEAEDHAVEQFEEALGVKKGTSQG